MFTPIHLLPQFNTKESHKYEFRWYDAGGQELQEKILRKIREGAGEDFLQWDFEHGELGFLESMWDLKGIQIFQEDITFPHGDNFEAIDFSFARFFHSKFRNACFPQSKFRFSRIYNCEFHNCLFALSSFYGAFLEKVKFINCDFVEGNSFINCVFNEVSFQNWYTSENLFTDCSFDETTQVDDPRSRPLGTFQSDPLIPKQYTEIYKGLKEGYLAGEVIAKSRCYYFKERQFSTRYNTSNWNSRIAGYVQEYITGYGISPGRVLCAMAATFGLFFAIFAFRLGSSDGLILTAGAFFTFGANTDLLKNLGPWYKALYIATSFAGISYTALFVTVLANLWFRER